MPTTIALPITHCVAAASLRMAPRYMTAIYTTVTGSLRVAPRDALLRVVRRHHPAAFDRALRAHGRAAGS